ncbi:MAG: stage III sporulation protein AD [Clostridiaceae bacterium]|jgi:stage III sporulation protein AD|nr:stage III sporulation protein AD [Clostridiaceae bacterium]
MEAELFRVAALGIIAAILAVIISEKKPELGLLLGLAFGTIALMVAFSKAGAIVEVLEDTINKAGIDGKLLVPVLKVTGMAYITQFSVDACKDVGQNSIAGKVETVGKIMMLVVAVPIATSLIRIISSII